MGLAVSQVRLLALTNRKADIELQMQINSKRKQMLTRKSTELSQQYYQRLQNSSIQYATSNGYEDVNYDYLMGKQANGNITGDFYSQVAYGYGDIASKSDSRMILTNQYGEVVLNDNLAIAVKKAELMYDSTDVGSVVATKTTNAILNLINDNKASNTVFTSLAAALNGAIENINNMSPKPTINGKVVADGKEAVISLMNSMLKNGGYKNGGIVYVNTSATTSSSFNPSGQQYYQTQADAVTHNGQAGGITLQDGYCYKIYNQSNVIMRSGAVYSGGYWYENISDQNAQYLANIIDYFGPMISAAIQNGASAQVEVKPQLGTEQVSYSGQPSLSASNPVGKYVNTSTGETKYYFYNASTNRTEECLDTASSSALEKYYKKFQFSIPEEDGNINYETALNTEKLQTGLKSGVYQLCMVTDAYKGIYHKNTTIDYFTHMNYVVDKTDTSKKEEITAWFNAEQAAISEQETYWDTEITNLSTELNSVNTEIDAVKQLKSNAIKSVFDWGSS